MKPKQMLDHDFLRSSQRSYWPLRSIGQLLVGAALSGLLLAALPSRSRPWPPSLRGNAVVWQPRRGQPVPRVTPQRDRSVIVARQGIDERMIITARRGIDEAMIVNPLEPRGGTVALWSIPGPDSRGLAPPIPSQPRLQPRPTP